jgi:hypothetical protein
MSDTAEEAIRAEIGEHWSEMIQNTHTPALIKRDGVHRLGPAEDTEMDARDIGIYDAGVLRGLELAVAAVEENDESG